MMKSRSSVCSLLLVGGLLSTSAHALVCDNSDVRITSVSQYSSTKAGATLSTITPVGFSTDAAACAGAFGGNDAFYPTTNLGYAGDGVLNGGVQNGKNGAVLFPGGAFITQKYPLEDIKGDGTANDPGWIMLGKYTPGSGFAPSAIGGDSSIVLRSFFSVTQTGAGTGTWAFTPDATAARRAATAIGNNWFDQFALVFKAGDNLAVYDFTPDLFGAKSPLASDPIMNWFGTYDLSDTLRTGGSDGNKNPAGLSHISLWARDPSALPDPTTVPEPSALALLGLAGYALVRSRKRATR